MPHADPSLDRVRSRHPGYPSEAADAVRGARLLAKTLQDHSNGQLAALGLNHPEYQILLALSGAPDGHLSPTELKTAVGEKAANLTRLADQLVARGWLQRRVCTSDRRKMDLALTPAGDALLAQALPLVSADLRAMTDGFSPRELAQLTQLQRKLLDRLHTLAQEDRTRG
ncbi:MarR family transcriptional regulator [Ideonella sp. B7]|nr:MarR family transcriptional regulator [Ideonella benzenivorans]